MKKLLFIFVCLVLIISPVFCVEQKIESYRISTEDGCFGYPNYIDVIPEIRKNILNGWLIKEIIPIQGATTKSAYTKYILVIYEKN